MRPDEFRAILRATASHRRRTLTPGARFRQVLLFLYFTGCRPCEASTLRWEHVDFERGLIVLAEHKTACLLKHALEQDASWSGFVAKAHHFKPQVSRGPLAALASPQQRSKARWMNLDVLVDWARESLLAFSTSIAGPHSAIPCSRPSPAMSTPSPAPVAAARA